MTEKGTQAFFYADKKSISIKKFQDTMKVVHILISSNILFFSYDEEKNIFLPYNTLPISKRELIGDEIEKLVNMSLDLKKKVDTSKFGFLTSSSKKEKAQNLLDSILAASYPYIR